jgi:deoxyribodipyrimidine photo-lyase
VPFAPGEVEAQRRLADFAFRDKGPDGPPISRYAEHRNRLDLAGTSTLSPYLRLGMLSARQATNAADRAYRDDYGGAGSEGAMAWLNELIWREFYLSILFHFPHVAKGSFRRQYDRIRWRNDPEQFAAWCAGRTGYPVVDAAMRQLQETGWMHNRARMIVASFLVKDLLIDWRWGERWFMQHLVDGDPASNNGGWQWSAGVGTDAAPYFRIFNPVLQGKKFDPQGNYVRRWLPALARVPDYLLHEPWRMSREEQREAGCAIEVDYPAPIVDRAEVKEAVRAAYAAAQDNEEERS